MRTASRFPLPAVLVALTAVAIISACKNSTPTAPSAAPTPVATRLVLLTPAEQLSGIAGAPLGANAAVQVQDAKGAPLGGATVTWTAFDGSSVASATSTTDEQGIATIAWTLGTTAGVDSLQASVGSNITAYLVSAVQAGPVSQLVEVSGDQQMVAEGSSSSPLVVKAVDQFGNAVSGVTVTWLDENGGALNAATTVTDANGIAQVTLTADPTAEQYVIVAQTDVASVTFVEISN